MNNDLLPKKQILKAYSVTSVDYINEPATTCDVVIGGNELHQYVIVSESLDNTGQTITNVYADIAESLVNKGLVRLVGVVWVEHYPYLNEGLLHRHILDDQFLPVSTLPLNPSQAKITRDLLAS